MKIQEILLIDDDPITCFINKKIIELEFSNFPVVILENGLKAIEYIRKKPQMAYLIFLDINMPVMDGWQFLEVISQDTSKYHLNIHILTSSLDLADKRKAEKYELVFSFLIKPLKKEIVKKIKLEL